MKPILQKKLLIFDYDGTLVNSSGIHHQALQTVLQPWRLQFQYESIAGLKTKDALVSLFQVANIKVTDFELDGLVKKKQELCQQMMRANLGLFPSVGNFLYKAKHHHDMAVVSSGSRSSVEYGLTHFKIRDFFKLVICAEDVLNTKPSPEGFLQALRFFDVSAGDALIFEDSNMGFLAARAAGVPYVDVKSFDWNYPT